MSPTKAYPFKITCFDKSRFFYLAVKNAGFLIIKFNASVICRIRHWKYVISKQILWAIGIGSSLEELFDRLGVSVEIRDEEIENPHTPGLRQHPPADRSACRRLQPDIAL